jgi:hypothetical protein
MISPISQRRDVAPALHEAVPSWLLKFLCCLRLAAPRRLSSIEDDRAPSYGDWSTIMVLRGLNPNLKF